MSVSTGAVLTPYNLNFIFVQHPLTIVPNLGTVGICNKQINTKHNERPTVLSNGAHYKHISKEAMFQILSNVPPETGF